MEKKDDLDDEPLGLDKTDDPKDGKDGGEAEPEGGDDAAETVAAAADDLEVVVVDDEPDAGKGEVKEEAKPETETEADVETQEDGEEALSGEDLKLSKNVQARIMRERAVRKRMVEAADARAQVEATARQAAENRMLSLELTTAKMADKTLKADIKEVKAELIAAKEAGETTKEVDAQEKLNALQNRLREIEGLQTDIEARVERAKTAPAAGGAPKLRPITQAWMERNKWFGTEKHAVATGAVKTLSAQLEREGISPDDPKHYTELDRRLHQELPSLRTRLRADAPRQANRPGPGTIVAPARQAPARGTSPNKVTLTGSDLQNMRSFGMDPNNKVHLQEYARSKQGVAVNE